MWLPQGNATTIQNLGIAAGTAAGTATARTVATTSLLAATRRIGYVSAAAAGNVCGWREGFTQHFLGNVAKLGGFFVVIRFGLATVSADGRWFVGISNSATAAPTNVEPDTVNNSIGIGCGTADTNVQAWGRSTGAITKQNLGASFPGKTANVVYELRIYAPPN
jgi:hypothetical protein